MQLEFAVKPLRLASIAFAIVSVSCGAQVPDDEPDGPCEGERPGLRVVIDLPCCDPHDAQLGVVFPTDIEVVYDVDTSEVIAGGTVEEVVAFPDAAVDGELAVSFWAAGDGAEWFAADATIEANVSECVELHLVAVLSTGG